MALRRLRTISQAVLEIKKADPDFPISYERLWRHTMRGNIPVYVKDSRKLVDMAEVEAYYNAN